MTKQALSEILIDLHNLISNQRSVVLASISEKNTPLASYAPFIWEDDKFYIFVSTLSSHTKNIQSGSVSIMFIEDEEKTSQIYARTRAIFHCHTNLVTEEEKKSSILNKMTEVHGEIISTLRSLSDFCLIMLTPGSGRFIQGFGKAYEIGENLKSIKPVDPAIN